MNITRTLPLLVLLPLALVAQAAPEVRAYTLDERTAEDVASQLRALYPEDQLSITARGQQMLVRAEPRVLDEIGQLVETLDVAPVQMRITVRSGGSDNVRREGGGISISSDGVGVTAEKRVTTTRQNTQRSLVVQSGQSAHITSGQIRTLPVAIQGGRNPAAILQQVDIRSGFLVTPQVISDRQVQLDVLAFDNDPSEDIPGYETEAVMTLRRVAPGEWVELGGSETRQSGNRSGITYQVGGDRQANQSYQVKVELLP